MTRTVLTPAGVLALSLGACSAAGPGPRGAQPAAGLRLEPVAAGLVRPVHLAAPPGDPRLFIVEQPGRIRVVAGGRLRERPFLDITQRVRDGGERGLLSVAFHPSYARNGLFFVNYTGRDGETRVERYAAAAGGDVADPGSAVTILTVPQPYSNHNGGHILFGPDGMLYVGMGDGGAGGDPQGHGQNPSSLLGKLLRIDVDGGRPYAVPADNPFAGRRDPRPEIWASGLRNPWRFCFDAAESLLYIADVGQNRWEEIHVAPVGTAGLNYGWNRMEGAHCFAAPRCDRRGLEEPVLEYGRADGCSVTGGVVYRGRALPALRGHYLYADYCQGWIRSFRYAGGRVRDRREWDVGERLPVSSFGEDADREVYVVSHDGRVLKIVPAGE